MQYARRHRTQLPAAIPQEAVQLYLHQAGHALHDAEDAAVLRAVSEMTGVNIEHLTPEALPEVLAPFEVVTFPCTQEGLNNNGVRITRKYHFKAREHTDPSFELVVTTILKGGAFTVDRSLFTLGASQ